MCQTVEEVRAHVLALLVRGYSPEEIEAMLGTEATCILEATALTDPTNVLMVEVVQDAGSR